MSFIDYYQSCQAPCSCIPIGTPYVYSFPNFPLAGDLYLKYEGGSNILGNGLILTPK